MCTELNLLYKKKATRREQEYRICKRKGNKAITNTHMLPNLSVLFKWKRNVICTTNLDNLFGQLSHIFSFTLLFFVLNEEEQKVVQTSCPNWLSK
jgi:hypothetical protein